MNGNCNLYKMLKNCRPCPTSGVMVSVLTSSTVDRWFELRLGETKDYEICICCVSAKHTTLRRKSKDWLARNQDNVSDWGYMTIRGVLFQWASTIKIHVIIISLKINLFSSWYSWKIAELALNNNYSLFFSSRKLTIN
jgi:hypothetical protein